MSALSVNNIEVIYDHVILVLPYSAQVHHLVDAAALAKMKPTATLVNIARGGIVDEAALADALSNGRLAAAGLDVYEGEPAVRPELLALRNVVLTPHIASASLATRREADPAHRQCQPRHASRHGVAGGGQPDRRAGRRAGRGPSAVAGQSGCAGYGLGQQHHHRQTTGSLRHARRFPEHSLPVRCLHSLFAKTIFHEQPEP